MPEVPFSLMRVHVFGLDITTTVPSQFPYVCGALFFVLHYAFDYFVLGIESTKDLKPKAQP